jgi:hypothetical protein
MRLKIIVIPAALCCVILFTWTYLEWDVGRFPIKGGVTVVRWDGDFQLDRATYYIDGRKAGVGMEGFDAVLNYLSRLEKGSSVRIEFPQKWSDMMYDGVVYFDWDFPFHGSEGREKDYLKLSAMKSLHLTYKPF